MNILIIAAHPDDEVYGCGGAISKFKREGNSVYVLIVTEGCSTQYPGDSQIIKKKKKEALKANDILGVKRVFMLDLPDMKLDTIPHVTLNRHIEGIMKEVKPVLVFTHSMFDLNNDHKIVAESTIVACRPFSSTVKELICYPVPSSSEWQVNTVKQVFSPNYFIRLDNKDVQKKLSAVKTYKTELRAYPHPRSPKAVNICLMKYGIIVGAKYAEPFELARRIL
jgi:LmbE family N-acetylglucosaminyl deacetylase